MARRAVDGIFLLDKPEGISSSQALVRVRGIYRAQKGGHTGALDPLASGLLPICLGQAAKFSSFFLEGDKRYIATGRLGEISSTADREGEIVERRPIGDAPARLPEALQHFRGPISQFPPVYSAVKVAGKPLYAYARAGRTVDIPSRRVVIHELKLLSCTEDSFSVEVFCSKGTYIRSLIADIGEFLGCGAYVTALRRTCVAGLPEQMMPLQQLQELADRRNDKNDFSALDKLLLPLELAVGGLPAVVLPPEMAGSLTHGVRQGPDLSGAHFSVPPQEQDLLQVRTQEGRFLGVVQFTGGLLLPRRMMSI